MKKIFSILVFLFLSIAIFSQVKLVEIKEIDKAFQGVWDRVYDSEDNIVTGVLKVTGTKITSANGEILIVKKVLSVKDERYAVANLIYFKERDDIWLIVIEKNSPYVRVAIKVNDKFKETAVYQIEEEKSFNDKLENI